MRLKKVKGAQEKIDKSKYIIKNPNGIFSIRYDWDDQLGHRIIDQKFGDIRYIKRTEMT